MDVQVFTYGSDNYGYLVIAPDGSMASVDAGDADAVLAAVDRAGGRLDQLWITHHHADHIDGALKVKEVTGCRVLAPDYPPGPIEGCDQPLKDGDAFDFADARVQVINTPGHTRDMINYHIGAGNILFTADTLFVMGCGRLFEGDGPTMWQSLCKLASLPDATRIYCGHEYTLANAQFALSVDPENQPLRKRVEAMQALRAVGKHTVGGTLAEERHTNPFLRAADPGIRRHLRMENATDAEVFTELRARKDRG